MASVSPLRTVAALYVDPRGPYPTMPGVDAWDESRDARNYPGPHPIVAHPPCGPWGRLWRLSRYQDATLAPLAVEQLLAWGGVLEHPRDSRLFAALHLPRPGEMPRRIGGRLVWALTVDQVRWGHKCRKATTLLFADVPPEAIGPLPPERAPTHVVTGYAAREPSELPRASAEIRRRTPPAFAAFLVRLAREVVQP